LSVAPDAWRQQREREAWSLLDRGVPDDIARRHVIQPFLVHGPNVSTLALELDRPVEDVARAFFLVGVAAYVDWLEGRLDEVHASTRWHRWALQAVEDDLASARRRLAERALSNADGRSVDEAVDAFIAEREDTLKRLVRFMRGLELDETSDIAAVTVAVRQIRTLAG
jgi:glutamate dehydrogenase